MRVVGGKWKGRALNSPADASTTRPTSDRNREALASMIMSAFNLSLESISVLDAFAGSGALGIEMLSRGAAFCTFVEKNNKIAGLIRKNLESLDAPKDSYELLRRDAFSLADTLDPASRSYELLLLDPPYATEAQTLSELVEALFARGLLSCGAIVMYERSAQAPSLSLTSAELLRTKEHGVSAFDLFRMEA